MQNTERSKVEADRWTQNANKKSQNAEVLVELSKRRTLNAGQRTQNAEAYLHSISLAAFLAPERKSVPSRERRTQKRT